VALRVLIVDDSDDDAFLLVRRLKRDGIEGEFAHVSNGEMLRAALGKERWDAVVSEDGLADIDALGVLGLVRAHELDVPFLVASRSLNEERLAHLMRAGVHDIVRKESPIRLASALRRELAEAETRRERRNAETALRDSELRYQQLITLSPDAIFVVQDERLRYVNSALVALVGASSADHLIGAGPEIFVHPDDIPRVNERGRRLRDTQAQGDLSQHRYVHATGSVLRVESTAAPISWQGQPATLFFVRDVTERAQQEAALRESEERYRSLVELLPDAVFVLCDDRLVYVNSAMLKLVRAETASDLIGKDVTSILHPEDWAELAERRHRLLVQGVASHFSQRRYRALDGSDVMIETAAAPIAWQGRRALLIVARDITERKKANQALLASEARFRAIAANVPGYIFQRRFDRDGRITYPYISEGLRDILGISAEDITADASVLLDRIHPDDKESVIKEMVAARDESVRYEQVIRTYDAAGGIKYLRCVAKPRRGDDGDEIWDGFVFDITEPMIDAEGRKALEARVRQLEKMESIGVLAGGVAHEFNNALVPIAGITELILRELPEASPIHQDISVVLSNARRAGDLVKKILSFSRMDEAERRPIALDVVIEDTVRLLGTTLPATIEICVEQDETVGCVLANANEMQQVLINLASNAADAMEGQIGTLTIHLARFEARKGAAVGRSALSAGSYAKLSITDTGRGIEPAILDRIFEPFFTTKEVGKGTGLGLSIIHGIVTKHGGTIDVRSTLSVGTTFDLYLPVAAAADTGSSAVAS